MAPGQEMPGVVGKMGVSESAQRITPAPVMRIGSARVSEARALSIYCAGTSASLRGSEGLPAHLLKIKQSAVMSSLISRRRGDEEHFSRKSRASARLNAQTSL